MAELARGFLAVSAWRRRDDLPDEVMADLRVALGWSRRVDEVRAVGDRVADRWTVAGVREEADGRGAVAQHTTLRSQRTWLVGERTGRVAVILDFAAAGATLATADVAGSVVDADVVLYPGSEPRRALFDGERRMVASGGPLPVGDLSSGLAACSRRWAANPFADRLPLGLAGVVPVADGDRYSVVDPAGLSLPMGGETDLMLLLALSGGHPVDLFGEWNGRCFTPLTVGANEGVLSL